MEENSSADPGGGKGKPSKPLVSQGEIAWLNAEHRAIVKSIADASRRAIHLGRKLAKVRARFGYREWIPWVRKNLEYSIRTAQRYILAGTLADDLTLGTNPAEFMAHVWGHKLPKPELEDRDPNPPASEEDEDSNNTTLASYCEDEEGNVGELKVESPPGEGVTFGPFPPEEIDKHGFAYFKSIASLTETFLNQPIAESEKLTLLQEVHQYIKARLQRQGEKMGIPPDELL